MTKRSLLEIPSGVQCFFGDEARLRREVERRVSDVFRGWAYDEIVLPLFDFDDVFTRGGGGGASSTGGIYRFIGREGDVMALRPDFTSLVAKVVVSRLSRRELPLRLFYSGEVLRYQPPRAGQREELYQIGLEHLGAGGVVSDVESLLVAREALSALGIDDAVITLGHVGFALSVLAGVEEEKGAALDAMRHHDRDALRRVLGAERAAAWSAWMGLAGDAAVLRDARRLVTSDDGREALERLEAVSGLLSELGLAERVRFDLGEVRGFEYYTGLVFEVHAQGSGLELGGGGRYDSLLGRFGRAMPAVGFSLSLDRLAELLKRRGGSTTEDAPESISIEPSPGRALARALEERRRGRRVRVVEA